MINKRFERRLKEGKLQGFNLSYQKVELQSDIGHLTKMINDTTDSEIKKRCQKAIKDLE
jgi:hypothetical protein